MNVMALESIGATGNNRVYAEVTKQNVNREVKAPQPTVKDTEEVVKKAAPALQNQELVKNENQGEEQPVSTKMKDAIDKVNKKIVPTKTRCEFSYHEDTKRVSIKVIDQNTEEVIREIPPEETLDMLSKMWELAGILVDERR